MAMPEIWVQCLIMVIIATSIAAVVCTPQCDPTLSAADALPEDCSVCVSNLDPAYGLMFLGLAAFLLGIFAQLLFARWWSMREKIQEIISATKNTSIMVTSFFRGKDTFSIQLRQNAVRWSTLSTYLVEKRIDGKGNFRQAVMDGLMTEAEWDRLEGYRANHVIPQQWAFELVCVGFDRGLCKDTLPIDMLLHSFLEMRSGSDDLLMLLETPLPYVFVHLMTVICKVNLLFTSLSCGTVIGKAVQNEQYLTMFIGYIIVILGNMLIEGLLRLHVVLSDPFGDDACDFPWELMFKEMRDELKAIVHQYDFFQTLGMQGDGCTITWPKPKDLLRRLFEAGIETNLNIDKVDNDVVLPSPRAHFLAHPLPDHSNKTHLPPMNEKAHEESEEVENMGIAGLNMHAVQPSSGSTKVELKSSMPTVTDLDIEHDDNGNDSGKDDGNDDADDKH